MEACYLDCIRLFGQIREFIARQTASSKSKIQAYSKFHQNSGPLMVSYEKGLMRPYNLYIKLIYFSFDFIMEQFGK